MTTAAWYLDETLKRIPRTKEGTPEAREAAAITRHLLIAKARLVTMQRKEGAT